MAWHQERARGTQRGERDDPVAAHRPAQRCPLRTEQHSTRSDGLLGVGSWWRTGGVGRGIRAGVLRAAVHLLAAVERAQDGAVSRAREDGRPSREEAVAGVAAGGHEHGGRGVCDAHEGRQRAQGDGSRRRLDTPRREEALRRREQHVARRGARRA